MQRSDVRPFVSLSVCPVDGVFLVWHTMQSEQNVTWTSLSLSVGSSVVPCSAVVRDLGVLLDSELSMKQHISKVISTCYYHLRRLQSSPWVGLTHGLGWVKIFQFFGGFGWVGSTTAKVLTIWWHLAVINLCQKLIVYFFPLGLHCELLVLVCLLCVLNISCFWMK